MIPAISWLWKQLNGPQITAFANAITAFMREKFNPIMDYFNTFSIDTADDEHLTTIGALQNVARPIFNYARTEFFYFTENYKAGTDYGFSENRGDSVGGKFGGSKIGDYVKRRLNTEEYRTLLKILRNLGTDATGIVFLDELGQALWEEYAVDPSQSVPVTYQIVRTGEYNNRSAGDVIMNLGLVDAYNDASAVAGIIRMISSILIEPQPVVYAYLAS